MSSAEHKKIQTRSGVVTKTTGSWYMVRPEDGSQVKCRIKGGFRLEGSRATNPVVVGDRVKFIYDQIEDTGIINYVEVRKNQILRRATNLSKESQVIAANIDQAFLMLSLVAPETYTEFVDRYLVSAESYRIPTALIFNKTDLYTQALNKRLEELTEIYTKAGYTCYNISATSGEINPKLAKQIKNKINLLSGNSGVGKSTFINILDPKLKLITSQISDYHKAGVHTTTFVEMHELSTGGYIIDTPGIKGFGLVQMDKEEIYHFFPEIFKYSSGCKYYNCLHINEPGCNVIQAVNDGHISQTRYQNYINIYLEEDQRYRI